MQEPIWTKAYYGTSHIKNTPPGVQITTKCFMKPLGFGQAEMLYTDSETPFSSKKTFTGPINRCKETAEKWFKEEWTKRGN
jgi:hypothetical protein